MCQKFVHLKKLDVHIINLNESDIKCETCGIICVWKPLASFKVHGNTLSAFIDRNQKRQIQNLQTVCQGRLSIYKCNVCDSVNETACRVRDHKSKHHEEPRKNLKFEYIHCRNKLAKNSNLNGTWIFTCTRKKVNRMIRTSSHKEKALKWLAWHNAIKSRFTTQSQLIFLKVQLILCLLLILVNKYL